MKNHGLPYRICVDKADFQRLRAGVGAQPLLPRSRHIDGHDAGEGLAVLLDHVLALFPKRRHLQFHEAVIVRARRGCLLKLIEGSASTVYT